MSFLAGRTNRDRGEWSLDQRRRAKVTISPGGLQSGEAAKVSDNMTNSNEEERQNAPLDSGSEQQRCRLVSATFSDADYFSGLRSPRDVW